MERENEKISKAEKKKEQKQIAYLLDMTKRFDPRIKERTERIANEKKEQKERERLEREIKKKEKAIKDEEERIRRKEQEKREEAEKKIAAKKKKEEKEKIKNTKINFKNLCRPHVALKGVQEGINGTDVEFVISSLKLKQVGEFADSLEPFKKDKEKFISQFNKFVFRLRNPDAIIEEEVEVKKEEEEKKPQQEEVVTIIEVTTKEEKEWTIEELANLSKGIKTFPNNSPGRWENIAKLTGRTVEEVQKKTNEMKRGVKTGTPKLDQSHHFQKFQDSKSNKSEKGKISDELLKKAEEVDVNYDQQLKEWTAEQQKLLETGLRQFKGADNKWESIGKLVGDKTAEDCKERYEYCKQLALQKRQK